MQDSPFTFSQGGPEGWGMTSDMAGNFYFNQYALIQTLSANFKSHDGHFSNNIGIGGP